MKEQHQQLLSLLNSQTPTSVHRLAQQLFMSESSVRRYLAVLANEGLIIRSSKGARLSFSLPSDTLNFLYREKQNMQAKQQIAEQVLPYLQDDQLIMMDDSSTVLFLVPYLSRYKNICVVTNSIRTEYALCKAHILTYCLGGLTEIPEQYAATGSYAEEMLQNFHGHLAVFSCKGLSSEGIATSNSQYQDRLRRIMMENCEKSLLLVDSSKIGHIHTHTCVDVADVDNVFCDQPLPENIRARVGIRKRQKPQFNQYHHE